MTKTEIIADITANVVRVVSTEEQLDPVANAAGIKVYVTNAMEQIGDKVQKRNITWYTVDEGQAGEVAYYNEAFTFKRTAGDKVELYLKQNSPNIFAWYGVPVTDEVQKVGRVTVILAGTFNEVEVLVYKNGTNWTHSIIT